MGRCIGLWLCLLFGGAALGQPTLGPQPSPEVREPAAAKAFLRDIWTDQKIIWSSPFRMKMRQWLTVGLPIVGVTAGLIATDRRADNAIPNTPDQVRWSGRVSRVGSMLTLTSAVGATMLVGQASGRDSVRGVGVDATRALVDATILTFGLKAITGRQRPMDGDGRVGWFKSGGAFPSGHAMTSFAVATAVARHPRTPRWLAIASYGAATAITLSRYGARKHSPADLFVGGTFGILIGNYVSRR